MIVVKTVDQVENETPFLLGLTHPGKTQVILAGDPKQLGPVLRSPIALKHGLQVSLLERIMTDKQFKNYAKGEDCRFC